MSRSADSGFFSARLDYATECNYIPIRVLGKGAFGEAVLYQKEEDKSLVVWKEVVLGRLTEKEFRDAHNEIDVLSILNHPNVISYYNHFFDQENLFIEMEYANGGNLAEKLQLQQQCLIDEEVVVWYFYQLTSALSHIHSYGVLHRDIKTLNIFLMRNGLLKLGDFGISRIMCTKTQMADSYVGTPYYMSPELIRGEPYNYKSDIWASGCVLYELLTLNKVFDATNPLRLASEIVRCEFTGVDDQYSRAIHDLLNLLLAKSPDERPSAESILNLPLFQHVSLRFSSKVFDLNASTRRTKESTQVQPDVNPTVISKSSSVYTWGGGKYSPTQLEIFNRERPPLQVASGNGFYAVLTAERELYTWATNIGVSIEGQLGHGDSSAYKAPKRVEFFTNIPIKQVGCGEDFTLAVTEEGQLYSWGSDYYGCLGIGQSLGLTVKLPTKVKFFEHSPVQQISCGDNHVLALCQNGDVYSWGCGELGRLGHGSEDDISTPQKVETPAKVKVKAVSAGSDVSFLICESGRVLGCGSNEDNKLGLNTAASGLRGVNKPMIYDVPLSPRFTPLKALNKHHVIHISAGSTHTAAIEEFGHVLTFGANECGQLGVGDQKRRQGGVFVVRGALAGQCVRQIACGDRFTVAATAENTVYAWGLAEDGRLGTADRAASSRPPTNALGSGEIRPNSAAGRCCSLPRPLFGVLHAVADLSCRHWQTIMIAEKLLSQKRFNSQTSFTNQNSRPDGESGFETDSDSLSEVRLPSRVHTPHDSSVPDWLKQELVESEFIPLDVDEPVLPKQIENGDADWKKLNLQDLARSTMSDHQYRSQTETKNEDSENCRRSSVQSENQNLLNENQLLKTKVEELTVAQSQAHATISALQADLKEKSVKILKMQATIEDLSTKISSNE